eukprot:TRINITY_DN5984_c0_g1_i2.p3 TRINITY_DN5984_c0_g1~~TRINITY_DN5984_c0_g1_i2.p3  ORF type:complete len:134 (+),score=3.77 TRINITY_DN5984_c0_g1_i2:507-908(+)
MPLAAGRRQADRAAERDERRSSPIGRAETSWIVGGGRSCAERELRLGDLGRGCEEAAEGFAAGDGEVGSERGFRFEELRVVSGVRGDRIGACRIGSRRGDEPREEAGRVRCRHCFGECRLSPSRAGNRYETSS